MKIDKKVSTILGSVAVLIFVVAFGLLIYYVLRGTEKSSGTTFESVANDSLKCTRDGEPYPYFSYDNSKEQSTSLNIVMDRNVLHSISLTHEMTYSDNTQSNNSYNINKANMNIIFSEEVNGIIPNTNYYLHDNILRFSIYADANNFSQSISKYFLDNDSSNKTIRDYYNYYEALNFKCELKER